jgi:hypothetical protein
MSTATLSPAAKAAAKPKPLSKAAANALWEKMHDHFADGQGVLEEIIVHQAWKPIGYNTFSEAWDARMSDVTLAVELRAVVVYQMFAEGADEDEVSATVKGVGLAQAVELNKQRKNGVPASHARSRKRNSRVVYRKAVVHVEVGDLETLKRWRVIAEQWDTTVEDVMLEQARLWFESEE